MSIESSDYCNNDFVEIHEESSSGRLLGHYCGNEIPANVTAGNNLWVLFRSDAEGQGSGFWADYELRKLLWLLHYCVLIVQSYWT